jgi:hypothetical protein
VAKANSDSTSIRAKTKELREELANADMSEFDRMMRHLVRVPSGKIEKAEGPSVVRSAPRKTNAKS